jgi:hypothetical protein
VDDKCDYNPVIVLTTIHIIYDAINASGDAYGECKYQQFMYKIICVPVLRTQLQNGHLIPRGFVEMLNCRSRYIVLRSLVAA